MSMRKNMFKDGTFQTDKNVYILSYQK